MVATLSGFAAHVLTVHPWVIGALSPMFFACYVVWLCVQGTPPGVGALVATLLLSAQYTFAKPKAWPAWRKFIFSLDPWSWYAECKLHFSCKIDAEKTMLCYHPHGALCVGFAWTGAHCPTLDPYGITFLVVDVLPKLPLMGWVINWFGNMRGASAPVMKRLLSAGRNVALIPGGFEEATIMKRGVERIYLKRRAGFIKYALRYGYKVHPCYTFGESDTYSTFYWLQHARLWFNRYKVPAIVVFGSWICPIFPRADTRINTFIGEPIAIPHLPDPSEKEVEEWHARYVEALQKLFDTHKAAAGKPDAVLEIW